MTDTNELVERLRYGIRDVETGEPLYDGVFAHVSVEDIREAIATLEAVKYMKRFLPASPRAESVESTISRMKGALEQAKKALQPFYNAVFNDNGNITVSGYDYDEAVDGYFAYRKIEKTLSALAHPPAQEPRAYIVHAPEDDYYGTGPDRLQFHPLTQHEIDNGYRQTPLYALNGGTNHG